MTYTDPNEEKIILAMAKAAFEARYSSLDGLVAWENLTDTIKESELKGARAALKAAILFFRFFVS